ncbi:hypothetical protein [Arthrobacter glacialis]|uniref:Uncharacterized protein n=1 Tax=Arthrobacter glacialis TaxID=1664 RepID=A0A2S3ZSR8_ARTGL|nr:hypothetical protein [Arthrobacter glacialis]POH71907.1 hypothetical protein CVS27_18565 [Arthrobacter glacialis]
MKVLAFILSMVVSTALMFGGIFLIVAQSPDHSTSFQLLAFFALTVMIYGPVSLGSMRAYWNVKVTEASRHFYKRWLWVVLGLEVLAAIAIAIFAVFVGMGWWLPSAFIAVEIVLLGIGVLVGDWLRRRDEAHPQQLSWAPVTRAEIARKIAIIAITFIVVLIAGILVLGIVRIVGNAEESLPVGVHLLFALSFASMGASFAGINSTLPLNAQLRDAAVRDMGTMQKVSKVVLRNKQIDLDENEQIAAAKYAAVIPTTLGFMVSYFALLYIGLGAQQVVRLVSGPVDAFTVGMLAALVGVLAFLFPYFIIRVRRARTYARDHADLLPLV